VPLLSLTEKVGPTGPGAELEKAGLQFARRVIQSPPPGVPYRETFDPNGPTWIFNPRTLLWVGETDGSLHGKVMGSVVLRSAIVDRLGQLPGAG
jgi:hypothetical protein